MAAEKNQLLAKFNVGSIIEPDQW